MCVCAYIYMQHLRPFTANVAPAIALLFINVCVCVCVCVCARARVQRLRPFIANAAPAIDSFAARDATTMKKKRRASERERERERERARERERESERARMRHSLEDEVDRALPRLHCLVTLARYNFDQPDHVLMVELFQNLHESRTRQSSNHFFTDAPCESRARAYVCVTG